MNSAHKGILIIYTVRHLKWTQIWHRVVFRLYHPKPDHSPAPEISTTCRQQVVFPEMPGCYLGNDTFLFLSEKNKFTGWNDTSSDKLWLYNLHYFDWLRQPGISEDEGNRWIQKWIEENPAPAGNGWEPYTLSLRIVNWIKWHLSGHELSEKARQSLAVQIRFLRKRLEYHLLANHFLANAKALVFAGMFFIGSEAKQWLKKGLDIYREQLPEQILPDGGHFELSPMYHSIILEDLLDLKNIQAPLELDDYIDRMTYWLSVMTGPDGEIALFNDAAHGVALNPDIIANYAESLGFKQKSFQTPVLLSESGYARLSSGDLTLIADCGEIGPSYQPGHAHADALSFEVWKGNHKIITNSGTYRYYNSSERKYQRSSAAHNTVVIDNKSSSEVWGAHRVARRGHLIHRKEESPDTLTASFRHYSGTVHQRRLFVSADKIIIDDQIHCKGNKTHRVSSFYHILDDTVKISMMPLGEQINKETLYSPEFGVARKKKTAVYTSTIHKNYSFQTEIDVGT